jgi:NIPSNAP
VFAYEGLLPSRSHFSRRIRTLLLEDEETSQMIGAPSDRPSNERGTPMAVYELRTYTLHAGKMPELVKLFQEIRFAALQKGGQDKKLVGFFQSDTGTMNQLIHLWKFDGDADRRAHWAAVRANTDLVEGSFPKFRPLVMTQEAKLLQAAPWGPHP